MTMSFRDPRVLSETVDTNSNNWFSPPPNAETAPDSDFVANSEGHAWTQGFVPSNATDPPATPPSVQQEYFHGVPSVTYPNGTAMTNVTKGPDERDSACAPVSDSGLKNARGAGGGSIG